MSAASGTGHSKARRVLAAVLIVLACVLSAFSVVAWWTRKTVLDTDRYVATVGPLADDPAIQEVVADKVTDVLVQQVDIEELVSEALPERASFLANPIATAVEQFVREATLRFVQSDQFQTLWEEANRRSHEQIIELLTGDDRAVKTEGEKVVIDLNQVATEMKTRLEDAGLTFLEDVDVDQVKGEIVLFQTDSLQTAQKGIDLLNALAIGLPVATLVLFALGVGLSSNRRKALLRGALGVAGAMLVLIVGLAVGRSFYLNAIPSDVLPRDAAAAAFDGLVRFLTRGTRIILWIGAIVALTAWVLGPSRAAERVRDTGGGLVGRASDAFRPGPVVDWIAQYRSGLRVAVVGLPAFALLWLDHPGLGTMLLFVLFVIVGLAAIAIAARVHDRGTVSTAT